MTSIEQLQVCGIRSFNPNPASRQVVTFHKPLTVILGKNGAGKTTIIEALLNACTGAMPPGSGTEKSAFVYDPKVLGESEVKAQIRLIFTGKGGKMMQVIRSFQASRLRSKVSFATLDNTIAFQDPQTGAVVSNTYRASDVDRVVPEMLGVSAAVLEHVIFCHQEDCNWPLAPPKDVKRIFDDIFAATRYVLALERLRENSKEFKRQQKEHETSLMALREHREQSRQLEQDLSRKEEAVCAIRAANAAVEPELQTLRTAAAALDAVEREVDALTREATLLQGRMEEKRAALRRVGVAPAADRTVSELRAEREERSRRQAAWAEELAEHTRRRPQAEAEVREAERAMYAAQTEEQLLRQRVMQHEQQLQQLCDVVDAHMRLNHNNHNDHGGGDIEEDEETSDAAVLRRSRTHLGVVNDETRYDQDGTADESDEALAERIAVAQAALQRVVARAGARLAAARAAHAQAETTRQAQRAAVQRSRDADDAEFAVVDSLARAAEARVQALRREWEEEVRSASASAQTEVDPASALTRLQQRATRQRAAVAAMERDAAHARGRRRRREESDTEGDDRADHSQGDTDDVHHVSSSCPRVEADETSVVGHAARHRDEASLLAEVNEQNRRVAQLRRTLAALAVRRQREAALAARRQRAEEQRRPFLRAMTQEVMPRLARLSISLPTHSPWDTSIVSSSASASLARVALPPKSEQAERETNALSHADTAPDARYTRHTRDECNSAESRHPREHGGGYVRWLQHLTRRVAEAREQCGCEESRVQETCQTLGAEVAQREQRCRQLREERVEHESAVRVLRARVMATLREHAADMEGSDAADSATHALHMDDGEEEEEMVVEKTTEGAWGVPAADSHGAVNPPMNTASTRMSHIAAHSRDLEVHGHACTTSSSSSITSTNHTPAQPAHTERDVHTGLTHPVHATTPHTVSTGHDNDRTRRTHDESSLCADILERYEARLQEARAWAAQTIREQHQCEATAACYAAMADEARTQHRCPLCESALTDAAAVQRCVERAAAQQTGRWPGMDVAASRRRARAAAGRLAALESVQSTVAEWRRRVAAHTNVSSSSRGALGEDKDENENEDADEEAMESVLSRRQSEWTNARTALAAVRRRAQELVELHTHLTHVYAMAEELDALDAETVQKDENRNESSPCRLDAQEAESADKEEEEGCESAPHAGVGEMSWHEASEAYEAATAALEKLHAALVEAQQHRCDRRSRQADANDTDSDTDEEEDEDEENSMHRVGGVDAQNGSEDDAYIVDGMECDGDTSAAVTEQHSGALRRTGHWLRHARRRAREALHHMELRLSRWTERQSALTRAVAEQTELQERRAAVERRRDGHREQLAHMMDAAVVGGQHREGMEAEEDNETDGCAAELRRWDQITQELVMLAQRVRQGWQEGHEVRWRRAVRHVTERQSAHTRAAAAVTQRLQSVSAAQAALTRGEQEAAQLERTLAATELQATLQADVERGTAVEASLQQLKSSQLGEAAQALLGGDAATLSMPRLRERIRVKLTEMERARAQREGHVEAMLNDMAGLRSQLEKDKYQNIEKRYRAVFLKLQTTEIAVKDVDKYYSALEKAVQSYHQAKITQINQIIAELWRQTYRGSDIDTVEICSESESVSAATMSSASAGGGGTAAARRSYNYRVIMRRGGSVIDMRGRCSAGQRVLASVIIRLALSEAFCCDCGILALDEPTTNLDEENARSLAEALRLLIETRRTIKHFQLIVITHDEQFVRALGGQSLDKFYYIHKDREGAFSVIEERTFDQLFA